MKRINAGIIRLTAAVLLLAMSSLFLSGCQSAAVKAETKAEEYLNNSEYDKAAEELTNVITKADPSKADEVLLLINAYYVRGDCYKALGENDKASSDYNLALEEDLKDRDFDVEVTATRYLRRGLVYVSREDYQSAESCFSAGLACSDVSCRRELLRNEIVCCEKLGTWDTAKQLLTQYTADYPDDSDMRKEQVFLETR